MGKPLRVLIVEDSEDDALLVLRELKRNGYDPTSERVETSEAMKTVLAKQMWDVVLSDYSMPHFSAPATLALLKETGLDLPFIVVSGTIGEETAVAMMKAGAHDYLMKGSLKRLVPAVERELREAEGRRERKRAEEALRESEKHYRRLIETAEEGIWIVDSENKTLFANRKMIQMVGYSIEEMKGRSFFEFTDDEDRTLPGSFMQSPSGDFKGQYDFTFRRKDGTDLWAILSATPISDEKGQYAGVLMMITDITERKKAEKQLNYLLDELERTRQQQLQIKDRFLSHVSHELRSPVAVIHQFVTLLLDGFAYDAAEQQHYLNTILRNVSQLRRMIDDLLESTRAERGELTMECKEVPIEELVREALNTFRGCAEAKGIHLSSALPDGLPHVYVDPIRVLQILGNLIDNGIKFTGEKGSLTVTARVFEQNPDYLCITVADTGCGIGHGDLSKIFERLYQAKNVPAEGRKGLGLGLHICKELVSRLKGEIWAESKPGQGSVFLFTLPIFSLSKIWPSLSSFDTPSTDAASLIVVEFFSSDRRLLTKSDEVVIHRAKNILEQLMIPGDVLLPQMGPTSHSDVFFIMARTDAKHADELVEEIRNALSKLNELENSGLSVTVSLRMLNVPRQGGGLWNRL
jgi:PAS domain S-box-containing protein